MKSISIIALVLVPGLFGSCRALGTLNQPTATSAPTAASVSPSSAGTLYARDGSVVSTDSKSGGRVEPEPKRELGEGEGSRASLLELYTKSVESRNELAIEVDNLRAALEQERHAATVNGEERDQLRADIERLSAEREALKGETLDLAARLMTAQIARLEAQKALLEIQIDARQREEAAAAARTSASQNSNRDKKRGGGEHQ